MKTILEMIKAASNDECKNDAMTTQLWSDGEITMTKGGDLFGQRSLHCIYNGLFALRSNNELAISEAMTHQSPNGYSYIFCSDEDAQAIRTLMVEL
ncbi:hypothetical protein VPHD249_0199 [Vibrio phage D249]|nr:hypothetical protein SIPHO036v1_20006 [Vibrio phage 70E38.1]QZI88084.1 hypothetical protein SIPHO041v1_p0173 [Vibrio phage 234P1]QZI88259.1 hypothetical protein SIPHO035v1_p0168 [Vibrio phage 234P7B]QZI88624.1 hypothetical protein SIPHO037v1_p0183 [Vibrio phage 70E35.2]QZI88809.1 hypothetical protein SIPHO039v1_p0180 [Vibrio phage 70E35.5a]QZI88992.1 hypothetical protein SIPHO040v1_p0179 [Vibrio phage 70E35.6]QZI89029.1 hypothetical protein SIPHO042v1_p0032 [Vibrio phage 70E37.1]QZI89257.